MIKILKFKICGITVQIKFLFVAIITIFLLSDTTGLAITVILSCVAHELGHIFTFCLFKLKPHSLVLDITGIKLEQPNTQLSFLTELIILLSGCITNFMLALIFYLINPTQYFNIIMINILIGGFNLLPINQFDGGKIAFILLSSVFSNEYAYKISNFANNLTTTILVCLSIFCFFAYELNLSYIVLTFLLILSMIYKKIA